ncbi:MAG: tetratricopeptide repeat protein [Microcystaceae cyanobacterium]
MNQIKSYLIVILALMPLLTGLTSSIKAQEPVTAQRLENLLISGMERGIKGDYQGAITIFSQVITLDAQAVEAYYNRGIAYFRMNQPQKAIADFNTTIELNPNHAEAYWERGKTYLILSQKEKAIQDFETALDLFEEQGNQVAYRWVESQLADLKDRQQ